MQFKDPLDPLRVPAPRHEYYSDDEDEQDTVTKNSAPTSADLSIKWESTASSSTSIPLQVLICVGAVTRPLEHGLDSHRSSRKGKMVLRQPNGESVVLNLEEVDRKESRMLLASTVGHLPADWQHPIAVKLLDACRSLSPNFEVTILDSYISQTFIHTTSTPYLPNPPIRFLRCGHDKSLSSTKELATYPSPNYVTGLGAALINVASHPSSPGTPTTLLLLPTPLHPSQIPSALSSFPVVSTALQSIWKTTGEKVWDDEQPLLDESGGRVDHHAISKRKGGKVELAEIGEGGMYI